MERRIMLLALVPMLIISGVDGGLQFGVSGDKGSYNCDIEADDGVGVSGHISLDKYNLAGNLEFGGEGELDVGETKSNKRGDRVTLVAKGNLQKGNVYRTSWGGVGKSEPIIGSQQLTGTGSDISCEVKAINKEGLMASVATGVGIGSIDILQSGTASKKDVYAWQEIDSASGDTIELSAATSDNSGNMADSSVTVDGNGFLKDYRSAAEATILKHGVLDLYAIHGPFNLEDKEKNPTGKIRGDSIFSEGSASNTAKGLEARYDVTIKCGSIEGRFDWGTETKSDGWVIAVPLESPAAWDVNPGYPGKIKISASKVWSYSEALNGKKVASKDSAYAKWVSVDNWKQGYGFAAPSEAKKK